MYVSGSKAGKVEPLTPEVDLEDLVFALLGFGPVFSGIFSLCSFRPVRMVMHILCHWMLEVCHFFKKCFLFKNSMCIDISPTCMSV